MRLNVLNYQQAQEIIGEDDMIEIMTSLEKKDDQPIENIMAKHKVNYILFWVGESRDIIFIKKK